MTDPETPADADSDTGVDSEVPWSDLGEESDAAGDDRGETDSRQELAGTTAFVEPLAYCRQCPHFVAEEPSCRHESARILEALPDGRFHVFECPVVTADGPAFDRGQRD